MSSILLIAMATDRYLPIWAMVYLLGGGAFVAIGIVIGWMIWRKCRNSAEKIEENNREAIVQFEEASEKVQRLKSELLSPGGE